MIKAAKSFKNQVAKVKIAKKEQLTLSAVELKEAERCWIRSVQGSFFFKEMAFLLSKDHRSTPPTCHTVWIVLRQRSYQVQGETEQCTAACELEEPHSTASEAQIKQSHESVKHNGIRDTLTTLRECYWVLCGREPVKKFVCSCVVCCKQEGTPYSPLPS